MKTIWLVAAWSVGLMLAGCVYNKWQQRAVGSQMCVIAPQRVDVYALGTGRGQVIHEGRGQRVRFLWPWIYDTGTIQAKAGDSVRTVVFQPWTSQKWTWYLDSGLVQRGC
jgi:hypothetical protein